MKPHGFDAYKANLLDRPSVEGRWCAVCGDRATDSHHVVQKGMGGVSAEVERRIPRIALCRTCHELVHARRLHFQWDGGWLYMRTPEPMKDSTAWGLYWRHYMPLPGIVRNQQWITYGRGR